MESAFRKRARKLHPDKSTDPDATARFQLILRAKNLLLDAAQSPTASGSHASCSAQDVVAL